jgi:hypothetical protein
VRLVIAPVVAALVLDTAASARETQGGWCRAPRARSLRAKPQLVFTPARGYHYVDNSVRVAGRYFLFSSERAA